MLPGTLSTVNVAPHSTIPRAARKHSVERPPLEPSKMVALGEGPRPLHKPAQPAMKPGSQYPQIRPRLGWGMDLGPLPPHPG